MSALLLTNGITWGNLLTYLLLIFVRTRMYKIIHLKSQYFPSAKCIASTQSMTVVAITVVLTQTDSCSYVHQNKNGHLT